MPLRRKRVASDCDVARSASQALPSQKADSKRRQLLKLMSAGHEELRLPSRREGPENWSSALIYNALSRGGEALGISKIKQTTCQLYEIRKIGIESNKASEVFGRNCKLIRHQTRFWPGHLDCAVCQDLSRYVIERLSLRCCNSR